MAGRYRFAIAAVAMLTLVGVACANNNSPGPSASGGGGKPGAGKKGCFVTDTAGINDKSFNQTSYAGLKKKADALGATSQYLQSHTQDDYVPNIQAFLDQHCDLIETNGYLLGTATEAAVKANPNQKFSIIDYDFFDKSGKDISYPNARELTFQTDQAAFLAGYLAAGMTKTGTVGTFGGLNIPTVTIFENGFAAGIRKYNQDNGSKVKLIGWDPDTKNGTFAGGADPFQDEDAGRRIGGDLIDEGADIILPVAGGTGLGAAAAAEDAGNVAMFWVDNDGCVIAAEHCPLFITSVVKHVDVATADTFASVVDGTFQGGKYVGTLANDGVGLAPYHDWDSKVPQELKDKITELENGIKDRSVSVDPADYPA